MDQSTSHFSVDRFWHRHHSNVHRVWCLIYRNLITWYSLAYVITTKKFTSLRDSCTFFPNYEPPRMTNILWAFRSCPNNLRNNCKCHVNMDMFLELLWQQNFIVRLFLAATFNICIHCCYQKWNKKSLFISSFSSLIHSLGFDWTQQPSLKVFFVVYFKLLFTRFFTYIAISMIS